MTQLFRLTGIRKLYGNRVGLEIADLSLREGALYTLSGPNGSGKSTLLRLLAFLVPPTAGELSFAGETVRWSRRGLSPLRRAVTLLHQSPCLFRGSVESNLAFGLAARGVEKEARHERIGGALDSVGLSGFEGRDASALSGGEAQRVAMARALALRPRVLLLDEPLAGVDRDSAAILGDVIAALPGAGTTVILSTHDTVLPDRLGTEVIRLEAGRISAPCRFKPEMEKVQGGVLRHARI
ncbi:MAG TPA: ATP-binding cassette domain-containing protein [Candidatus Deferrimicrobiaceae bacterium]|jgi:tungstate transport system ATP-binding protein